MSPSPPSSSGSGDEPGRGSGINRCPCPGRRKHQQYDCKWYVPLADLVFPSPEESEHCPQVHVIPDHELEDMKMKISAIKSEVQKEVRGGSGWLGTVRNLLPGWVPSSGSGMGHGGLGVTAKAPVCSPPTESQQGAEPGHRAPQEEDV